MEWNNINTDRDTSGLGPIEYDRSRVPSLIRKYADDVRTKTYGQEVREAQARNAEYAGLIASEANSKATNADILSKDTQNRFNDQIAGTTNSDEVIDARGDYPLLRDKLQAIQGIAEFDSYNADTNRYFYNGEPMVSFMFDDGLIQDWDRFKPIFDSESVPGNICIITDWVEDETKTNTMTLEQIKTLKNNGWTVASHTATHPRLADISTAEAVRELERSHDYLKKHGLDYDILVYPYGSHNNLVRRHARKFYNYAIDIDYNQHLNTPSQFENIRITRGSGLSQPKSSGDLENCKSQVDQAIANNDWLIFEDHSHYAFFDNQENLDKLRDLIRYIKSKGVRIVNIREGVESKANLIEVDNFAGDKSGYYLQRDGNIRSGNNMVLMSDQNSHGFNTPIDSFPENKISVSTVSGTKASTEGFPDGASGTLKTYYINNKDFAYQEYDTIYGKQYNRIWESANNKWSLFMPKSSAVRYVGRNVLNTGHAVSTYAQDKITIVQISKANMGGIPTETQSGLLITYRFGVVTQQEFRGGSEMYIRYAYTSGLWSEWVKIG